MPAVRFKTKPFETGPRQNYSMPLICGQLAQTRRHVAVKIDNLQVGALPMQLMLSAHAAGRNNSAGWQRMQVMPCRRDQDIVDGSARKNGRDLSSRSKLARQIFRAVDGNVDFAREQRALDFAGEQSFSSSAKIDNRFLAFSLVAARFDRAGFKRHPGPTRA